MGSSTTITATARVLKNYIQVDVGSQQWTARPMTSAQGGVSRAISALFSTRYQIFSDGASTEALATVSYEFKRDEILIQVGERKWRTRSSLFGPTFLEFDGTNYSIYEKITGRFAILHGEKVVAQGQCRFRSVTMNEYPPAMETFLAHLSVGILIRTLVSELAL